MPDFSIEEKINSPVIGLDEVGRGPLAGPVISCGCNFKNYTILNEVKDYIGDSKKLSGKKRELSFKLLQNLKKEDLIDFHLGIANVKEIDNLNILSAVNDGIDFMESTAELNNVKVPLFSTLSINKLGIPIE